MTAAIRDVPWKGIVAVDAAFDSVELAMDGVYIYNAPPALMATNSGRKTMAQYGADRITWYDRNGEDYCGYS